MAVSSPVADIHPTCDVADMIDDDEAHVHERLGKLVKQKPAPQQSGKNGG